jgi:hypothetical protein
LNILDSNEPLLINNGRRKYDLILDKGCLDTFLFRSGSTNCNPYPPVLRTLLDNIHLALVAQSLDIDNKETAQIGIYVILSPRKKIKAVRDYQGFSKVQRIDLSCNAMEVGDLDTKKDTIGRYNHRHLVHFYICKKNHRYNRMGHDAPFCPPIPNIMVWQKEQVVVVVPTDEETCKKCNMTFYEFRKGEKVSGRGCKYWTRRWVGHGQHCQN